MFSIKHQGQCQALHLQLILRFFHVRDREFREFLIQKYTLYYTVYIL